MKKLICIAMALVLLFVCLTGCSLGNIIGKDAEPQKTESKKSDKDDKNDKTDKDDEDNKTDRNGEGENTPSPSPENGSGEVNTDSASSEKPFLLHPLYTKVSFMSYSEKVGRLVTGDTGYFTISEEELQKYPYLAGLNDMLTTTGERDYEALRESFLGLTPVAEEAFAGRDSDWDYCFEDTTEVYATRTDSSIFSVRAEYYGYSGGVHGYYATGGFCYDTKTGKKLSLDDIILDKDVFINALADKFMAENEDRFKAENVTKDRLTEYIGEYYSDTAANNFFMDYEGLSYAINPYEIMSYAGGRVIAKLYYDDYPGLFKNSYELVPDSYITPVFMQNEDFFTDLDGDGERERVSYRANMGEYYYYDEISIGIDGKEKNFQPWCYDAEGYYVKASDIKSLYLFCQSDNDIEYLAVYDISAGTVIEADKDFNGGRNIVSWSGEEISGCGDNAYGYTETYEVVTDPASFNLSKRTQILSTDRGMKNYYAGRYGIPQTNDEFYKINYPDGHSFTLLQSLELTLLAEDGSETVFKKTVQKGEEISLIRTDENTIVDFALPGGGEGRATIKTGWPQTINGIDIEKVLTPCLFAG